MEIDLRVKYLATGDVNGVVKIWDVEEYCLQSDSSNTEKNSPRLLKIQSLLKNILIIFFYLFL
jgi:hypothetical protein